MPNNNFKKITLTGMMGSGKTIIGKLLAKKISIPFYDSDERIESKLNLKISEIFSKYGEKKFRQEEELICKELLNKNDFVLALGGGAILNKEIQKLMLGKTLSIWIKTNIDVLFERLKNDRSRPLLNEVDLKKEQKASSHFLVPNKPMYRIFEVNDIEELNPILNSSEKWLKNLYMIGEIFGERQDVEEGNKHKLNIKL